MSNFLIYCIYPTLSLLIFTIILAMFRIIKFDFAWIKNIIRRIKNKYDQYNNSKSYIKNYKNLKKSDGLDLIYIPGKDKNKNIKYYKDLLVNDIYYTIRINYFKKDDKFYILIKELKIIDKNKNTVKYNENLLFKQLVDAELYYKDIVDIYIQKNKIKITNKDFSSTLAIEHLNNDLTHNNSLYNFIKNKLNINIMS